MKGIFRRTYFGKVPGATMHIILFIQLLLVVACNDPAATGQPDTRDPVALLPEKDDTPSYEGPPPVFSKVNVFNRELLLPGYTHFRIPALVSTNTGTLLAFCEMRTAGDLEPKTIVYRRSTDNGETWSPVTLLEEQTLTKIYGNETVVVDRNTGDIHVIYLQIFTSSGGNTCNMYHRVSSDDGVTWSDRAIVPNVVSAAWRPAGPGTAIQLQRGEHAGRLLFPGRYIEGSKKGNYGIYSDDGGVTWKAGYKSETGSDGVENETTCVELNTGGTAASVIYVNSRNESSGSTNLFRRLEAYSHDSGETLEGNFRRNSYIKTDRCQGALLRWSAIDQGDDRNRILFSSVTWAKEKGNISAQSRRRHVGIWSTFDETESWETHARRVQDLKGGYSSMAGTQDGLIAILFEEGESNYFSETSLVRINEAFLDVPLTGARWDFEALNEGEVLEEGAMLDDTYHNGNGRNIEVKGTVQAVAGAELFHQRIALAFNGNTWLRLSDADTWTQFDFHEDASFTVEVVLKADANSGEGFLVGRPHQSTWPQWYVQLDAHGHATFRIDDDENSVSVKSSVPVADGRWHHVAAVRDRQARKLFIYVDGDLSGEITDSVTGSLANRRDLFIGGTEAEDPFEGQIDFVRISPAALDTFFE